MRKLLISLFLLFSISSFAQETTQGNFPGAYRYKNRLYIDSLLLLPNHDSPTPIPLRDGAVRYNSSIAMMQLWKGGSWNNIGFTIDTSSGRQVDNISTLRITSAAKPYEFITVKGYYIPGDEGGGQFYWNNTAIDTDNGGTIIQVAGVLTGRWIRLIPGSEVIAKWFGAKGDGTSNDRPFIQAAIDAFVVPSVINNGANIVLTKGIYRADSLIMRSGIKFGANQTIAKDNYIANVPVTLKAFGHPDYIIKVPDSVTNCTIENLYIEGEWQTQPQLLAGVRLGGTKIYLIGNNINNCAQIAVLSTAGLVYIEKNGIYGWYGAAPSSYTGINDFRGALHVPAMGDSYIYDNEIGAGLNYFTSIVIPRDTVNGRICAMSLGTIFGGTSVISGNLFENGDRAVAIGNSLYCTFHNNRYELSAMGGLYIYGPMQFATFSQERFSDNSLRINGGADDVTIGVGAAGHVAFIGTIFERLANGAIPNSVFKCRWNISNFGSDKIEFLSSQIDTSYYLKGIINNEDVFALPVSRPLMQFDTANVRFTSVSTEKPVADPDKVGYSKLIRGTNLANGDLIGGHQFYKYDGTPIALLGFNAGTGFNLTLNQTAGDFGIINGGVLSYKNGGSLVTLNSIDGLGNNGIVFKSNLTPTHQNQILVSNTTGISHWTSDVDMYIGSSGTENFKFASNGLTYIPYTPSVGDTASDVFLMRNPSTGEIRGINHNLFATIGQLNSYNLQRTTEAGSQSDRLIALTGVSTIQNVNALHLGLNTIWSGNILGGSYSALNILGDVITNTANTRFAFNTTSLAPAVFNTRVQGLRAIMVNDFITKPQLDSLAAATGGTITSVGLSLPSIFSVSGSPITSSGTLMGALVAQSANTGFFGPASGGAATPTFRALIAADIPALPFSSITGITLQNTTSATNGNNTNQIIQIKGLGGAVLPGYALEMFMDSTSTPKTGDVNAINRPSGLPIELRLNYLAGTYASPATVRLGGAGNDVTVVGGNGIDSGHTNLICSGSAAFPITTIINNTILDNTNFTVLGNNSSNITITLPTASSCTGRIYHLKKISNNANTITINAATGVTIDGSATATITTYNQSLTIQSSGTVWVIL